MSFRAAAHEALLDQQLRKNLGKATSTIRDKRASAIGELENWEELRSAAAQSKDRVLDDLENQIELLESRVAAAGGTVHHAQDAAAANRIVARVAKSHGAKRIAKVKSMATDEIGLNEYLEEVGIEAVETDLAELIVQLAEEKPSHILVPAIHKNRTEIRNLFSENLGLPDLSNDPKELAEAARVHLREFFLDNRFAVSGANFAVAETGSICIVESEGNGRMCTTLPEVLVTVMGIEKLVSTWDEMGSFLQLLPRSATGERMNPYTSFWHGVRDDDGPQEFHLILLDAGRRSTLADPVGRQALRCIRCSACLNVCPVYSRVGGHAYESVYPGPIGAILTPQLREMESGTDLPGASSLCGACADVCPVKIEIPDLLVHLRAKAIEVETSKHLAERGLMKLGAWIFRSRRRYQFFQNAGRMLSGRLFDGKKTIPVPGPLHEWTRSRDLAEVASPTFREWWKSEHTPVAGLPVPAFQNDSPVSAPRVIPPSRVGLGSVERIDLFCDRVGEYRASVHRCSIEEIQEKVMMIVMLHGARRLAVPEDLDPSWIPAVVEPVPDRKLSSRELDAVDGSLTSCALGIAETGTIVLDGNGPSGRRALTLVPDLHICIVAEDQIVQDVPEAVAALESAVSARRPLTFVSGPSATSDIELSRVEGVHGPRRLEVLVVRSEN